MISSLITALFLSLPSNGSYIKTNHGNIDLDIDVNIEEPNLFTGYLQDLFYEKLKSKKQLKKSEIEAYFLSRNRQIALSLLPISSLVYDLLHNQCPLAHSTNKTDRTYDDARDALMHFLFSGLLTHFHGADKARYYLLLREIYKGKHFEDIEIIDGQGAAKPHRIDDLGLSEIMDIHNNEEGIDAVANLSETQKMALLHPEEIAKYLLDEGFHRLQNGTLVFFESKYPHECQFLDQKKNKSEILKKFVP